MQPFAAFDFKQAKANHLLFKSRLRSILFDEVPEQEATVLSQYACAVGKWLYSHALIQYESIPEVHELERVHASIHIVARELIKRYKEGKVTEARQGLSEMEQVADRLVDLLNSVEEKVRITEESRQPLPEEPPVDEASALLALLAKNELLDAKIKDQVKSGEQINLQINHERKVLHDFFMQAPAAHCILRGPTHIYELANPAYQELIGGRSVLGLTVRQALPELEGQGFYELLDRVFTTCEPFVGKEIPIFLDNGEGHKKNAYLNFIYQPILNAAGNAEGILVFAYEVTDQVTARKTIEASEAKLRTVMAAAPVAMGLFVGRDLHIDLPNQAFIDIVGKGPDIVGKPLRDVMPELKSQQFLQILDDVYTSGITFQSFGSQVTIVRQGVITHNFHNITYTPLFEATGNVYAILGIGIDVTEQVLARQQLEQSEQRFRQAVEQAPVAILVVKGDEFVLDIANQAMLTMLNRDANCIGQPLEVIMPELIGQSPMATCRQVYQTGEPYFGWGDEVLLNRTGQLETGYFNVAYTPYYEGDTITGVMQIVTEVTEQVRANKELEASEKRFRGLIEKAPVAMTLLVGQDLIIQYPNETALKIWGSKDDLTGKPLREALHAFEGQPFMQTLLDVYKTGVAYYAQAATAELVVDGRPRTIYFNLSYQPLRNDVGDVYAILVIGIDVTQQVLATKQTKESEARYRELSAELDTRVRQRTEALEEANTDLRRSNENLEQFAYIASHDLQEPLRKIQQFGDLLKTRYAASSGDELVYLERMQSAARRMSMLIKDLLAFSRISTRQASTATVPLNQIVDQTLENLSVVIDESSAQIRVSVLPTVQGDASQLGQLFQNLLSNALKFRRPGINPDITIHSHKILAADVPFPLKTSRQASLYHRIEVSDNGIGFDEKYTDRIFQVFQRLHGKDEFAGTGIGLAICQKVVTNHGGAITASSQQGKGTTFFVYLPT